MNKNNHPSKALSIVKTGLFMIANAMMVHEALATSGAVNSISPLAQIDLKDPVGWLTGEWSKILSTNYRMVFEPAIRLLKSLPSHYLIHSILVELSHVARRAVANRAIFRHDLAGRLYHTLLLREVAKGLATYYTSIPAATILASLALDYVSVDWGDMDKIRELRIADYACGSGTLLSAVYTEIVDRYVVNTSGKPDISLLHKVLLENVIYGLDVLEYAVHLASTSLILRNPVQIITDTNTYVVPLGVVAGKVYLGSLSMEANGNDVVFPVVKALTGVIIHTVAKESIESSTRASFRMKKPALVIMNPPFARTGNVGKSSLFGHLPRAERREVLDGLNRLGMKIAKKYNLAGRFGRAGLAAYFLMKSYEVSQENGVLAFVLPRVFLSGSDWASVREFLAKRGRFRYIIVSDDRDVHWAWSENTDLSEILLIYQKHLSTEDDCAIIVYVRKRPRSALEAKVYSSLIKTSARSLGINKDSVFSPTHCITMRKDETSENEAVMYVYKVKGEAARRVANVNLNIIAGFHSSFLGEISYGLYVNRSFLGRALPLISLKDYVIRYSQLRCTSKNWEDCIGYDVAQVRRKCINKGKNPVPYLKDLNMNTFSSLKLSSNSLQTVYAPQECVDRAGRLIIGGIARLRLTTVGIVAAYHDDPVLSQVAWTIPLDKDDAKIQVLWLNSTPGLIHFLSLRQDSAGGFVQLKKRSLGDLLLLDSSKLSKEEKSSLIQIFDKFSNTKLERIYTQIENASKQTGHRFEIDTAFLQALGIPLGECEKNKLIEIYKELLGETILKP